MIWSLIAKILARSAVSDWLIRRALKTPYTHIAKDGDVYMYRWWLFNPYPPASDGRRRRWADWLPSARIHLIRRPDEDRHPHDHPWNARTVILRGWYDEVREGREIRRAEGTTAALKFGEFHRITEVCDGGVFTLFITSRYQGTWGFLVDGVKVPWREYLNITNHKENHEKA